MMRHAHYLRRIGHILGIAMYLGLSYTWLSSVNDGTGLGRKLLALSFGGYCLMSAGRLILLAPPKIQSNAWHQLVISFMMGLPLLTLLSFGNVRTLWEGGAWIGAFGGAGMIVSIQYLGTNWAIVPGFRKLVDRGPYRWVRHPVYTFYVPAVAGFLLTYYSPVNLLVIVACILSIWVVTFLEERTLSRIPQFADYYSRVPYRFIPGVF